MGVNLPIERVIEVRSHHHSFNLPEHINELALGQPAQLLVSPANLFIKLLEHVDTHFAGSVDLWVVNLAAEEDLGRILRVTLRTEYFQRKHATFEGRIFRSIHLDEEVPVVLLVLSDLDTFYRLVLYHSELLGAPVLWLAYHSRALLLTTSRFD